MRGTGTSRWFLRKGALARSDAGGIQMLPAPCLHIIMATYHAASQKVPDLTEADLEKALALCARIIDQCGDKYWPIYERIEAELDKRRARQNKLKRHLSELS